MFPLSQNPSNSSRGNGRSSSSSHNPHNRNYGAAFFQMMTIALLCTSLAQPSWLSLTTRTNVSPRSGESCPKHLTLYQFFDYGYFETGDSRNSTAIVTPVKLYYHSAAGSELLFFIFPSIRFLFKYFVLLLQQWVASHQLSLTCLKWFWCWWYLPSLYVSLVSCWMCWEQRAACP